MESWERNSKPGFNTKVVETPKSSCEAFGSPSIFNLVPSEEKLVSVGLYNKFDYVTRKETQQVGFMLLPWGKKRKAATRGFIRLQCSSPIYLFIFFALCKMYLYSSVSHSHSGCGLYLWQHDCSCCTSCPERIFQFSGCRWSCRENIWFVSTQLFDCMWESSSRLWGVSTLKQRFGSKRRQLWRTETKMFFITSNKT